MPLPTSLRPGVEHCEVRRQSGTPIGWSRTQHGIRSHQRLCRQPLPHMIIQPPLRLSRARKHVFGSGHDGSAQLYGGVRGQDLGFERGAGRKHREVSPK